MLAVDWALAVYAIFVALVAVIYEVPAWPYIVVVHGILVVFILALPARGAAWERPQPEGSPSFARLRIVARFLRYTYPALLLTSFFEEVTFTVNAAAPGAPYWFEPLLYSADRRLFGVTPAVALSQAGNPVLDVWYPFLPARGPWEDASVMSGLRPFGGWLFTDATRLLIVNVAVSGGTFPSAHVSGTWALTFGLHAEHPKAARWFGAVAAGLSLACVYTRYHHGVDVLAGLTVAAIATAIGYRLVSRPRDSQHNSRAGHPASRRCSSLTYAQ